MKIAVTSQNFRTVTPHAGRTRRFLVYAVGPDREPMEVGRLDLPREQSMHDFPVEGAHPLDAMDMLVVASCGPGFARRLARRGIQVVTTDETDPVAAVRAALTADTDAGSLDPCGCGHEHGHRHRHAHRHTLRGKPSH